MSSSSSSSSFLYSESSSSSMMYSESSSSSSSIDSSSSSSSSYLDYNDSKLIPFTLEELKINPSWKLAFSSDYLFLGTGSKGEILKSSNKYHWGLYYKTEDIHVTALYVDGNYLYAGTSPQGKIYKFDLTDNSATIYDDLNQSITDIIKYNDEILLSLESGNIYKYNSANNQWDFKYKAYAEIIKMKTFNNKLYLALKSENIISYDGENWELVELGNTNFSSIKKVINNLSFVDFENLNISGDLIPTEKNNIYEVHPLNKNIGISCLEKDGTSIVLGSYNKARIYSLINNNLNLLFDTDLNKVNDIINIDLGVNLAAIDNKLYLIYCGSFEEENVEIVSTEEESLEEQETAKNINIISPAKNDQFELGQDIIITWSSNKNQNDAVKLSLYQGNEEIQIIASQTSNDGSFEWTIPLSLETGIYKVYIEWLSAGTASNENKDFSDGFSISITTTTTTTTTTQAPDPLEPDISTCSGIPILVLPEDEEILSLINDNESNSILLTTSKGRIIECKESTINGYLTGNRKIYANVQNGFGFSNSSSNQVTYALYNKIAEVNANKEIEKWKFVRNCTAINVDKVTGVFLSPALVVQEDIGVWKQLLWTENKPNDTEIIISLKATNDLSSLENLDWQYSVKSEIGETGTITRSLNNSNLIGKYMQIKVEMTTKSINSPSIADISLVYTTKFLTYFFSTLFSLQNESNINKGLVVAKINEPINTQVQIAINNEESNDWNDYQIITSEKFFDISDYESIKIAMKFNSFDETHVPEVTDFGIIFSGDDKQIVS